MFYFFTLLNHFIWIVKIKSMSWQLVFTFVNLQKDRGILQWQLDFGDSRINNSLLESSVSQICPQWILHTNKSVKDLWKSYQSDFVSVY